MWRSRSWGGIGSRGDVGPGDNWLAAVGSCMAARGGRGRCWRLELLPEQLSVRVAIKRSAAVAVALARAGFVWRCAACRREEL